MVEVESYTSLLIVAVIAFIIPFITKRIGIPVIVGEIGLGILVGYINLGIEHQFGITLIEFSTESGLELLAEIGFIFLLFLAGLEIDINLMEEVGKRPLVLGGVMFCLAFGIAYGLVTLLGLGIYMALVLSTTSVGVVIPIVREMGISKTKYGQDIILAALVADFLSMLLIPFALRVESADITGEAVIDLSIIIVPLIFIIFYVIYKLGGYAMWRWPNEMAKFFRSDDPSEMGVRASFMLIMVFIALSQALGVEVILGAFLAGTAITMIFREGAILERKLFGFGYGFLVPLFFIEVGVSFANIASLEGLTLVPALVGIAFVVKIVPALAFWKEHGPKRTMAAGLLLSARLSLIIAAVRIGLEQGVVTEEQEAAVVLLALIMCIVAPIGFRYLYTPEESEQEEPLEEEPVYEISFLEEREEWPEP